MKCNRMTNMGLLSQTMSCESSSYDIQTFKNVPIIVKGTLHYNYNNAHEWRHQGALQLFAAKPK